MAATAPSTPAIVPAPDQKVPDAYHAPAILTLNM
jgi:hypothetical protein